jgi:hypothetical protein
VRRRRFRLSGIHTPRMKIPFSAKRASGQDEHRGPACRQAGTKNSEGHRGKIIFFRYGGRKERKNREKQKPKVFLLFLILLFLQKIPFSVALWLFSVISVILLS